ncbi:MAG: glycosyltransferase family 9 protein [Bacteroidota bacterium]
MFDTPILFIVFNRPDVTLTVFNEIRKAKPRQLFIAADGPRANRSSDFELCRETREIFNQIDWPCSVKTLFRTENLGCGKSVSSAINWFFEHVEQGIILEDDCLPHPSFFMYCQDLLEYHKDNDKVMHIGGVNFQNGIERGDASYYFSGITHVWGWASWRRAWKNYNFDTTDFYTFVRENKIYNYFENETLALYWLDHFKNMYYHKIDTWDHQWTYAILNHGGLSIIPNTNLISNIGFRDDATHTSTFNPVYAYARTSEIERPLKHPRKIEIDREADFYFFNDVEAMPLKKENFSIVSSIKGFLARLVEYSLKRFVFTAKIKNPNKNILIQKVDAIGDYVITRNFLKELISSEGYRGYQFYLLANIRLKSFIEVTDKKWFKDVLYFDESDLKHIKTKYSFLYKLRKLKFHTIIHATYSRNVPTDDLIFHSGAPNAIGFLGDTANISAGNKSVTDTYYTHLIDVDSIADKPHHHEFEKQRIFFETIIGRQIPLQCPDLRDIVKPIKDKIICICPGSNEDYKKWNSANFSKLIEYVSERYPLYKFKIICGPNEAIYGHNIITGVSAELTHKIEVINTQSIMHLLMCISNSSLVIGNDSAPIHIATALAIPNVCIFNGSRYGRFVPYPDYITNSSSVVVPEVFASNLESVKIRYYNQLTHLDINKVKVEDVFAVVSNLLSQQ